MENQDVEEWKPVPGYDGLYSVSSHGRVMAETRIVRHYSGGPKLLKEKQRRLCTTTFGYLCVTLSKEDAQRRFHVHRLVLMAFVGDRDSSFDACHLDGNRLNNRLTNLRWDTRKGNMADCIKHGRTVAGERNVNAKLASADIPSIRFDKRPQHVIAAEYGVHQSTISDIKRRKLWRHI